MRTSFRERWGYPLLLVAWVLAMAVVLLLARSADAAEPFVPGEQASLALALKTWGIPPFQNGAPCAGVAVEPLAQHDPDVLGRAIVGECTVELDWRTIRDAAIEQDSGYGRAAVERWHERTFVCTVIVHEVGHLAGQEHSADPHSVMYPQLENTFAPCRALFRKPRPSRHLRRLRPDPAPQAALSQEGPRE